MSKIITIGQCFTELFKKQENLAVASKGALRSIQFLLQYWLSRSSKVDDFFVIWKAICDFLL